MLTELWHFCWDKRSVRLICATPQRRNAQHMQPLDLRVLQGRKCWDWPIEFHLAWSRGVCSETGCPVVINKPHIVVQTWNPLKSSENLSWLSWLRSCSDQPFCSEGEALNCCAQVVHTKFACQWSQWKQRQRPNSKLILHMNPTNQYESYFMTPIQNSQNTHFPSANDQRIIVIIIIINGDDNNDNSDDHTDQIMSWKASKASELPMGLLPRSNSARKCFFWSKARTPGASPWRDRADRA